MDSPRDEGDGAERESADHGHDEPHQVAADAVHGMSPENEPRKFREPAASLHRLHRASRARAIT